MESFESLTPGSNIAPATLGGGIRLVPGTTGPFTFGTGVVFSYPVPNVNDSNAVFVSDYARGAVGWGLGVFGTITSSADVPFGTAYMNTQSQIRTIEYTFPENMQRVGAYVLAVNSPITLEVYNGSGTLLETRTVSAVNVANWGNNFLGIENQSGIRRARFIGETIALDGLMFERRTEAIPSMTEWGMIIFMVIAGLGAVYSMRRHITAKS